MHPADDGRKIAIDSGDERQTGRAAEPGRGGAQDGDTFQQSQRGNDTHQAGARTHDVNGLQNAGEYPDLLLRHGNQHRERGAEVDQAGNDSAEKDGNGKIAARIADLIAHDGSQIQTDEAVADGAKGGEETPIVETGAQIRRMESAGMMMQGEAGQQTNDGCAADGAQGAEIADPFAQRETTDVQGQQEQDDEQRGDAGKGVAVGQLLNPGPAM